MKVQGVETTFQSERGLDKITAGRVLSRTEAEALRLRVKNERMSEGDPIW